MTITTATTTDLVVGMDGTQYRVDVYLNAGEDGIVWLRAANGARVTPDQADALAALLSAAAARARMGIPQQHTA